MTCLIFGLKAQDFGFGVNEPSPATNNRISHCGSTSRVDSLRANFGWLPSVKTES